LVVLVREWSYGYPHERIYFFLIRKSVHIVLSPSELYELLRVVPELGHNLVGLMLHLRGVLFLRVAGHVINI